MNNSEDNIVKDLKVDITKLKRFSAYAKSRDLSVQRIYQLADVGSIKVIEIDGVKFVHIT